jgi:membrane protein
VSEMGRAAERPSEIPARGFIAVLKRVRAEVRDDNVPLLAAGLAFYAMLALFPALIAVVTVYGLVADPQQVADQIGGFAASLPEGAGTLLTTQLQNIAGGSQRGLTVGLAASLLGVLWSASGGVQALIKGLNLAYDEKESRGFLKLRALALVLTLGAIVVAIVVLALIAAFPAILERLGLGSAGELVASYGRWVLLALLVVTALAVLYRYAPDRRNPRWRWVSWGAVVALVVWLAVSIGFSAYVENWGRYGKTYGALAGVIVLLLWLWLTGLAVLLGGEVDAEIERQTARDTTVGPDRPRGERGADAADTVGDRPR